MTEDEQIIILNQSSELINRYIFDRSVVIAAHDDLVPFDHGTGMLLRLNECSIVITAAHVISRYKPEEIQIISTKSSSNIRNAPFEISSMGGSKVGQTDVGFLRLSEDSLLNLRDKKFLTLDDFEIFPEGLSEDLAVIFGMPEEAHSVTSGNIHSYDSFSYYSNIPKDFDWVARKGRPVQIEMEYPEIVEDASTRIIRDLPEPAGMSGGGIWRARFKGAVIWTPERLRLIGITTEFYPKKRKIKANRIEEMMQLLAKHFPSAKEHLQKELETLNARALP